MTAPIGGPYADWAALKRRSGIPDVNTFKDIDLQAAVASASSAINRHCGRQFGRTETASARSYRAGRSGVDIDDVWTMDDLVIDDRAYAAGQAWELEPQDGIVDGVPGWPFNRLATPWMEHPIYHSNGLSGRKVLVVAKWGWAEVPPDVTEACLLLAADSLRSGDAPFGVAGFGDYVVRVRANPKVAEKLAPYVRTPVKVA